MITFHISVRKIINLYTKTPILTMNIMKQNEMPGETDSCTETVSE